MKMKLSAVFMLTVLAVAAFVPLTFGVSVETIGVSAAVVAASTFLVEKGVSLKGPMLYQLGEVGSSNIEAEYKKVQADLKKVGDDLKAYADQAQKDIQNTAKMSEETRAKVDELLVKQGELQANLQAAEQVIAKLEQGGGGQPAPKSMGETFTESDEFKARAAALARGEKGSFSVSINASITEGDSSAGDLIVPQRVPGIVGLPQRRLTIRDIIAWGRTTSNAVEFARELVFTNNADVVSENPASGKPKSDITFESDSVSVATIAHYIHASKQVLSDVPMLQSLIDGRLRYGLKLKEEAQLLKGSGVGLNIDGIYTQATAYSNPGVTVQNETLIDRLRLALLQAELSEYSADAIVLNPIDWATIELTKTTDNAYLFANPRTVNAPGLWGRNVVPTQSMDAGEFLTGVFGGGLAVQGWDREDVSVTIATQDQDDFIKNMVKVLCEERVALTVYRPSAFIKGDFDDLTSSS